MTKDAFLFAYGSLNPVYWKEAFRKALSAAIKSGFMPEFAEVSTPFGVKEDVWKNIEQLVAFVESHLESELDTYAKVNGTFLSKYMVRISFGFNRSARELYFFVESEDEKWLKATTSEKAKLNELLKALSQTLGVNIEEPSTSYEEIDVGVDGFIIKAKIKS